MMPSRRKSNSYSSVHSPNFSANTSYGYRDLINHFRDRRAFHMSHIDSGQNSRVEVRIAEGTVDPRNIRYWGLFLLHFFHKARYDWEMPENANWLTLDEGLDLLGLINKPDSENFYILDEHLAGLRQWILARTAAYSNFRDAQDNRRRAKELEGQLYQTPYGIDAEAVSR